MVLGIRYLTTYAVATDIRSRNLPEWPPHPGRIFMAMAAAHFEGDVDPGERAALEWLEAQGPPAIHASEANARSEVRIYVPVNDEHGGIVGRSRQDRTIPRVRPDKDVVYLIWRGIEFPEGIRHSLERLCAKVTRIGHSSSLVQMWVVAEAPDPEPTLVPDDLAGERFRIASSGTLSHLEAGFDQAGHLAFMALEDAVSVAGGKEQRRLKNEMAQRFPLGRPRSIRPQLSAWQGYARVTPASVPEAPASRGPFDPNIIILTPHEGGTLGLESTLQLSAALRRQAMSPNPKACPEWLSGHQSTGEPSQFPHAAFFPLPFVGFPHADGHVMGLGIAIPRGVEPDQMQRHLGPLFFTSDGIERPVVIERPSVWKWTLFRESRERPPRSLQAATWTAAARAWATVTPIVLHHHPKRRTGDVERIVREAFASAQFPEPASVCVQPTSFFEGAGHERDMPAFAEGGKAMCTYHTHVVAFFSEPVEGPMLVGRGRYRGYGLMRPLNEQEVRQWRT